MQMNESDLNLLQEKIEKIYEKEAESLSTKELDYIKDLHRKWEAMKSEAFREMEDTWNPIKFLKAVRKYAYARSLESFASHNILHGQYDSFDDEEYWSSEWEFRSPIDGQKWKREHNGIHHTYTNVLEKDPDLHNGIMRTHHLVPWDFLHIFQIPWYFLIFYPKWMEYFNSQNDGSIEYYRRKKFKKGNKGYANIKPDGSETTDKEAFKNFARSNRLIKRWNKENIYDLANKSCSSTRKMIFGLKLAELILSYEVAFTIQATHQCEEKYAPGYFPESKGGWYLMQIETTRNFELGNKERTDYYGGLNYQIEHHLFPDIPYSRYPELSVEIKKLCSEMGIKYREDDKRSTTYLRFLKECFKFSFPDSIRHFFWGKTKLERKSKND